jgi:hypothetical protein
MANITELEASVLLGIDRSCYNDYGDALRWIWVFSIEARVKGKALGGVLTSLQTKGLLEMGECEKPNMEKGTDAWVSLTDAGREALASLKAAI